MGVSIFVRIQEGRGNDGVNMEDYKQGGRTLGFLASKTWWSGNTCSYKQWRVHGEL